MTFDNKLKQYFRKKMLVEPTMPIHRNEIRWLAISRQIVTLDKHTSIEVTNPKNEEIILQTGTFIGTWYQSDKYVKAPFTFKNSTAAANAKILSNKINQVVEKLSDTEVKENMQILKENIQWLQQFNLNHIECPRVQYRLLIMCLINENAFQKSKKELGLYVNGSFDILLTDTTPVKIKPYTLTPERQKLLTGVMTEYKEIGAIKPSTSEYNSPTILVTKKGSEKLRGVVDYRTLNSKIQKYTVPLRATDYYFNKIQNARYYIILDVANAYMQLMINPLHQKYTAFTIGTKKWESERFNFGLNLSGNYWLEAMEEVYGEDFDERLIIYVDDLLIFGNDLDESFYLIDEVLKRAGRAGIKIKPSKTQFFARELSFLGFHISEAGIRPDAQKIQPLFNMAEPHNKTSARSFLGIVNFFRKSVSALQLIASPIHKVTGKNSIFKWGDEQKKAYYEILHRLSTSPILVRFAADTDIYIYSDSSQVGGAAWMLQKDANGEAHLIATYSKKWPPNQRTTKIAHLETIIVVQAVEEWGDYLATAPYTHVFTDNSCLAQLLYIKRPSSQQNRWLQIFSKYRMSFYHVPSAKNVLADHMSRMFTIDDQITPGYNHQILNYPTIAVSPEAIRQWKENAVLCLQLEAQFRRYQSNLEVLKSSHSPEYKQSVEYILIKAKEEEQPSIKARTVQTADQSDQ